MTFNTLSRTKNFRWSQIKPGDNATFAVRIGKKEIKKFIELSKDVNPLHQSVLFAREKGFDRVVVPGMLLASFFSTLVGTYLPGRNNLYLSQSLQFKKPIFTGETIRINGRVKKKIESVKILYLETQIFNKNDELAVMGEAVVKCI